MLRRISRSLAVWPQLVPTGPWPARRFAHVDRPRGASAGAAAPARPRARSVEVIGVVRFSTHRNEPAEAILDADGRWRCPKLPVLDRVLNILFDPNRFQAGGLPFGCEAVRRVAAWIKGTVAVEPGADPNRRIDTAPPIWHDGAS